MAGSETHHILPLPEFDRPVKVLIVVAPYYKDIADDMIAGARAELEKVGALGCVIRGETTHYDTVCNDSSRAIQLLGLEGACIGNGILTVENRDQAVVRADPAQQNKGGGAAAAALHLIALTRRFAATPKGVGFKPGGEIRLAGTPEGGSNA